MNTKSILETAIGLKKLGMLKEAEAELLQLPPAAADELPILTELTIIRLGLEHYDEAIETGRLMLARAEGSRDATFNLALALDFAGRSAEARTLLASLPEPGADDPSAAYQMACLDSKLGAFESALGWLALAMENAESYSEKALIDSDLRPLWLSLQSRPFSLAQAHTLWHPAFAELRSWIGTRDGEIRVDGNDLRELPEDWRQLFRFESARGTHGLHPLTVARFPEAAAACAKWYRDRLDASLHAIEFARESARAMILQNQPAYAALHLAEGNFLGARYHILWALAQEPASLETLRAHPGLRALTYLFDEIAALQKADREACRMLIEASLPNQVVNVPELLDEIPPSLHDAPLYLLRQGQTLHHAGDHAGALAVWLRLCAKWPRDVVGFGNAASSLMQLGRWEDAEKLLSFAPRAYRHFHLCEAQQRQLHARDVKAAGTPPTRRFRGDPSLGGLLCSGVPVLAATDVFPREDHAQKGCPDPAPARPPSHKPGAGNGAPHIAPRPAEFSE